MGAFIKQLFLLGLNAFMLLQCKNFKNDPDETDNNSPISNNQYKSKIFQDLITDRMNDFYIKMNFLAKQFD